MHKIKKFPIGGTHLPENKDLSTHCPITVALPSAEVIIPLRQHLGVTCRLIVEPGESIKIGQIIGMNDQGLSARIHSSASGKVQKIEPRKMSDGGEVDCVIITPEASDRDNWESTIHNLLSTIPSPVDDIPPPETVADRVEAAGIVGMGGAAFPTHLKLKLKPDMKIDTVLINGAECEPFITTDDRLMQEQASAVFRGLEIIRRTVGASQGYVACEINKPDAIKALQAEASRWEHLQAVRLDTRYPHGAEKHLIKAVLNREVPIRQLPMAVGVVVNNVQTAVAIAAAVDRQHPLIARVLTVSGTAVRNPGNFLAPIGTPIRDMIEAAGGTTCEDPVVIVGGPMTGIATTDLNQPITKSTSGIVLLPQAEYADRSSEVCIRCARCVSVCPMYLQPNRITAFVNNGMLSEATEFGLNDCILCGACSFVCPSRRPLLQWLRTGKAQSAEQARKRKSH
jgi:Na+-translocating ferredoxin:NAD+ oxidoreductase subunit C